MRGPGLIPGLDGSAASAETHERLRSEFHKIFTADGLEDVDLREQVLDAFLASDEHVSAREIAERLGERGIDILEDRARQMLELFTAYGIAHRQNFEGIGERFEHLHIGAHHDHFVCVECGSIVEFESPEIEQLQEQVARKHGFRTAHHRLVIYGICKGCCATRRRGFPLAAASLGEILEVVEFRGPRAYTARLAGMGLNSGARIEVMRNDQDGPVIVARGDTRLGIDRDLARRILVVPAMAQGRHPGACGCNRCRNRAGRGHS